jgi:hypothetical protein
MNDEEHEYLTLLRNEFYKSFSRLVGETVSRAPEHLRGEFLMMLEDQASVHGSAYVQYVTKGELA